MAAMPPEPGEGRSANDLIGVGIAMIWPAVAAWLYFFTYAGSESMTTVYAACKIGQFALPIVWLYLFGRNATGPSRVTRRDLAAGALSGLAMVALMAGLYIAVIAGSDLAATATPRIASRVEDMGIATPVKYLALTLFLSIAHSFLEEYYWRWFVFGRLCPHAGYLPALVISSLAFAGHHVIVLHAFIGSGRYWWMTVLLSVAVAAGGGVWAWHYQRSGSLLPSWISHALVDFGIMAIGYEMTRTLLR